MLIVASLSPSGRIGNPEADYCGIAKGVAAHRQKAVHTTNACSQRFSHDLVIKRATGKPVSIELPQYLTLSEKSIRSSAAVQVRLTVHRWQPCNTDALTQLAAMLRLDTLPRFSGALAF